jgi:hypothetical protein
MIGVYRKSVIRWRDAYKKIILSEMDYSFGFSQAHLVNLHGQNNMSNPATNL